jgi:hypothetical protein
MKILYILCSYVLNANYEIYERLMSLLVVSLVYTRLCIGWQCMYIFGPHIVRE